MTEKTPPKGERIAKVLAHAGIASRRDAEVIIADGRVTINGEKIDSPVHFVQPGDVVTVDGKAIGAEEPTRMWLFHKPAGCLTTTRDPKGRPTVFDKLPKNLPRVVTVGRLDYNSEGLLLLTNDGGLSRYLTLRETAWIRRYRVRVYGKATEKDLDKLRKGFTHEGIKYLPIEVTIDTERASTQWLTFSLREGKNREIRKLCEALGMQVTRLIRVSFGPFQLGKLEKGEVAELTGKILREQLTTYFKDHPERERKHATHHRR